VLVFSRKRDQSIVIGEGIEVRILRVGRDTVRLGVTAAADVPVHRGEVYDAIRRANAAAAADAGHVAEFVARYRHPRAFERR
jgi:carbon storage regulator